MEVLLNSFWLLVAIGAFLCWQTESGKGARLRREHSSRYRFMALSVVLILLFPVISVTDDLHADQTPMEDSSRSVMKARSLTRGCLSAARSPLPAAVTHVYSSAAAPQLVVSTVVPIETSLHSLAPVSAHDGRSPPSPQA